jgi:hypothetical protein
MTKYYTTNEDFQKAVSESFSFREVLMKLGYIPAGGNYETLKRRIKTFGIDITHFRGQGWNGGKSQHHQHKPLQHYFDGKSIISSVTLKERLIKEQVFERKCYGCDLVTWKTLPIPLELDHIDGNRSNNKLNNLRLLCPNCHAQTPTYRRSKASLQNPKEQKEKRKYVFDSNPRISRKTRTFYPKDCLFCRSAFKAHRPEQMYCSYSCHKLSQRKIERPSLSVLQGDIASLGFSKTGRKYGVSDNAVRKWLKRMVVESSHSKIV